MQLIDDFTVEVRDSTLTRCGVIAQQDLLLNATSVFNDVGTWELTLPLEHRHSALLRTPGSGLVVSSDKGEVLSGPMTNWSLAASTSDPIGTLTITGVTDDVILSDRLAFPQPSNPDPTTQNVAFDKRTGVTETLMQAFVNLNIGPGAPAGRRDSRLIMGANGARGPSVAKSVRFAQLGPTLAELAAAAGLGFRVIQRGAQLALETFAVTDRSTSVRLDVYSGTLSSQEVTLSAPSITRAILGGDGTDSARAFYLGTTPASLAAETTWGRRIESFVNASYAVDTSDYVQASAEALADGADTQVAATLTPADTISMRYGTDWGLGDKVTAMTDTGEYAATVSSAIMLADTDGLRIGATLGNASLTRAGDATQTRVTDLASRLSALERNV